jgi:hypothetical protein
MHASNLAIESENMGLLSELCGTLEAAVSLEPCRTTPFRNGDAA